MINNFVFKYYKNNCMYKNFFGLLKDVFWNWKIINVFIKYKSISIILKFMLIID